jgi:uncharacterized membrane protein YhhN
VGNEFHSLVQNVIKLQKEPVIAGSWWIAILAFSGTGHVVRRREVVVVHVVGLQILTHLTDT